MVDPQQSDVLCYGCVRAAELGLAFCDIHLAEHRLAIRKAAEAAITDLREQVAQLTAMHEKHGELRAVQVQAMTIELDRLRKIEAAAKRVASTSPAASLVPPASNIPYLMPGRCPQCEANINELRDAMKLRRLPAPANTPRTT